MLPKRKLGNTGLEVTQLGYGSMGIRGPKTWGVRVVDEALAERILHEVLDAGINFIDTAPDYGISEERIGRYLASRRSEFYLATKCGCAPIQHADHLEVVHTWTQDTLRRNVENSLDRLQTDYLDLIQFHGGDAETLRASGLLDLLQEYRAQGIVRHIGMSNKLPELESLLHLGVFETFQVPFSCLAPEHDRMLRKVSEQRAGVIIRGGIAQGGPDAEIQRPTLNDVWQQARLDEVLPADMDRAELILRYTLSMPYCDTTIVGTCSSEHLQANVRACQAGPLPEELRQEIEMRVQ